MENKRMSLQEKALMMNSGLAIMVGRDNGELKKLVESGDIYTITDFDFLTDSAKNIDYAVFIIEEDDSHFYFGGTVLTESLQQLELDGYKEDIQKEGLPVKFGMKQPKDKKKQAYTTVTFYPSEE